MKLTKYEHACFVLEKDGQSLVVDPGEYTTDFVVPDNVVGIVITHEHPDHLSPKHLEAIVEKSPNAVIVAHESITSQLGSFKTQRVTANEGIKAGNFELEFFGGEHAVIHPDIPVIANLGVMIDDTVYYPGDSYTDPERPVKLLALPVAAPWMKLSEAVDFVRKVAPDRLFPTHDAVLSDAGKGLPDRLIPALTNSDYVRLTEPLDLL